MDCLIVLLATLNKSQDEHPHFQFMDEAYL